MIILGPPVGVRVKKKATKIGFSVAFRQRLSEETKKATGNRKVARGLFLLIKLFYEGTGQTSTALFSQHHHQLFCVNKTFTE